MELCHIFCLGDVTYIAPSPLVIPTGMYMCLCFIIKDTCECRSHDKWLDSLTDCIIIVTLFKWSKDYLSGLKDSTAIKYYGCLDVIPTKLNVNWIKPLGGKRSILRGVLTGFWNVAEGISAQSTVRALVRSFVSWGLCVWLCPIT